MGEFRDSLGRQHACSNIPKILVRFQYFLSKLFLLSSVCYIFTYYIHVHVIIIIEMLIIVEVLDSPMSRFPRVLNTFSVNIASCFSCAPILGKSMITLLVCMNLLLVSNIISLLFLGKKAYSNAFSMVFLSFVIRRTRK